MDSVEIFGVLKHRIKNRKKFAKISEYASFSLQGNMARVYPNLAHF